MTDRPYEQNGGSPRPRTRKTPAGGPRRSSSAGGTRSGASGAARKRPTQARAGGQPPRRPPTGRRPAPRGRGPQRKPGRRWLRGVLLFLLLVVVAVAVTGCAVYNSMEKQLPDPDLRKARGRDQSTVITDRTGSGLVRLFAEQNRQDVAFDKIPEHVRNAVIATEDKRYYEHEGVDPLGIARALWIDITTGEKAQGGSTITQQYVKQAFVGDEASLKRKIKEAILSQKVERRYDKNEILELYLNTIYYGHGAYGVEAASNAYFGKRVGKLSVAEAAVIAGVIKSPGRYSPYIDPKAALQRRNTVLMQMRDQGYIDAKEYAASIKRPIKLAGLKPTPAKAPYFVEWVKDNLVKEFGEKTVYRGGLKVRTTLDPAMQRAAEQAVQDVLNQEGDPSAAVVAIRPSTGEVLAMVGGRDFKTQQYNVAVQGKRQPGSAFKPFVLATALGEGVSPEQPFPAGPRAFQVGSQTWKVTGAHGGTAKDGTMRLRQATEQSVNSVYAQLILDVGAEDVVATAEDLGIQEELEPVPAIALGGLKRGVSPLEMARAYATLANGGERPTPYGISKVASPGDGVLSRPKPKLERTIDPAVAYLTTDLLTGVIKRGTGTAANIGRPAAGKTGTTQEYRDAWFVGYTPDLVCAVWVGYPESQREMKSVHGRQVTGGSFPAEIWARFMKAALADTPKTQFTKPKGLTRVNICSESGELSTEFCPKPLSATVIAKYKPEPCTVHTTPVEVVVPNVIGLTKLDALSKIEMADLKARVIEKDVAGVTPGTVASQNPGPNKKVEPGLAVTIVVSSGGGTDGKPVAAFAGPQQAKPGEQVTFDAKASTDDGKIVTFYWEFGDGATAAGKKASHAWSSPGTYEITLWVTDDKGQQASATKTITIK